MTAIRAIIARCLSCLARALGLHLIPRKHRHRAHLGILGVIAMDLLHSGAKLADLGFLFLSVLMEVEEIAPSAPIVTEDAAVTARDITEVLHNDAN